MDLEKLCKLFPGFLLLLDLVEILKESEPALSGAGVEAALELDDNCVKRNV
jgi:hypothetical protein